jgi:hypothetical protein
MREGLAPGRPFAEAWNGTSWRVLPIPNLPGAAGGKEGRPQSVSCTGDFRCMAVGGASQDQGDGGFPSFAEAWNGTSWRLVKTANPRTGARWLNGVSCTAAGRCMAVGNSHGLSSAVKGTGAFAEVWNGISWHLLKVPAPRSLVNGPGLTGVSCPLASRCVATGSYFATGASIRIVAEAWNGTTWRELRPLNP